jgi:hypothetical protein
MRNLTSIELGQVNGAGVPNDFQHLIVASFQIANYASNPYVILGVGVIGVSCLTWWALS